MGVISGEEVRDSLIADVASGYNDLLPAAMPTGGGEMPLELFDEGEEGEETARPFEPSRPMSFDEIIRARMGEDGGPGSGRKPEGGARKQPQAEKTNPEKGLINQSSNSLKKGIRAHQRHIAIHEAKIANPKSVYPNWDNMRQEHKQRVLTRWQSEINAAKRNIANRENLLKEREKND